VVPEVYITKRRSVASRATGSTVSPSCASTIASYSCSSSPSGTSSASPSPVDDHRLGQVDVGPESGVVRLRLLVERVLTAIVAVAGDEVLRVGGVDRVASASADSPAKTTL